MNSNEPLYETNYLGCWIKVYPKRVVFKKFAGENNIPINQISSVQLGMMGLWKITLETTGGKKYEIPCHKKKEVREAIYKAQEAFSNTSSNGSSMTIADELAKLVQLKEKSVLSEVEFEEQKKKLLS